MALATASLISTAIADLIPSLYHHADLKHGARQLAAMLAAIATITLFHSGE